jgi:ATP-dependent DNA helicase RecG
MAGDKRTTEARERLAIMELTNDGFKVAEKDLEIRKEGDILGTRQSGVPTCRIGNLVRDRELVEVAKREADYMLTKRRNSRDTARLIEVVKSSENSALQQLANLSLIVTN